MVVAVLSLADNAVNLPLLLKQLRTRVGVVPFVGAGASVPFGFPAWRKFLEDMAPDSTERQRVAILLDHGQYEEAAESLLVARGENAFQAALEHTFSEHRLPKPLAAAAILQLPRLCSGPVLTTNFDPVLEKVFENARRPFEERILGMNVKALREAFDQSRRVLVKLHGDAADRSSRVLTRSDYERAYGDHEPLKAVLRFAMQARPLLFVGCSLGNDRTVRVLESLAGELRRQKASDLLAHYAIVERPPDDVEFSVRHQRLKQLGVFPIWYPTGEHHLIADLLAHLAAVAGRDPVCGQVPKKPLHYLLRDAALAELRGHLLTGEGPSLAITGQGSAVGVQGMGGVGKTVLAAALTRDPDVQRAFPDGIFWVTVGQQPNLLGVMNQLASWLPDCESPLTSEPVAHSAIRQALAGKRALLILDDVWHLDHAAALNLVAAPARLLVTTRKREVLIGLAAHEFCVDVLGLPEALCMLADWAGVKDPALLPPQARDVAQECGRLPLALAMIGAMVHLRPTAWSDALGLLLSRDLDEFRRAFPDYPYPDLLRAIAVSVDELPPEDRERYLDLAVFSEDQAILEEPLQVLWNLTPEKTRICIDRLVARSLATWQEGRGRVALLLHDLHCDYIWRQSEGRLKKLHGRVLEGYAKRCRDGGWPAGPNDGYFFQEIVRHLKEAGREKEALELLLRFEWLSAKLQNTDVPGVLADFDRVALPPALRLVEEAIRLSAAVVGPNPDQLAGQLLGRLAPSSAEIERLRRDTESCKVGKWLRPIVPSLTSAGSALRVSFTVQNSRQFAATADGKLGVSVGKNVQLWDMERGILRRRAEPSGDSEVQNVAIKPDGQILTLDFGHGLRVWDPERLVPVREMRISRGWTCRMKATLDNSGVAVLDEDGMWPDRKSCITVWDLVTGRLRFRKVDTGNYAGAFAMTCGNRMVVALRDATLQVLDSRSGRIEYVIASPEAQARALEIVSARGAKPVWAPVISEVHTMDVTPDGRFAVCAAFNGGQIILYDLNARRCVWVRIAFPHEHWVSGGQCISSVAVTPNGRYVLAASSAGVAEPGSILSIRELSSGDEVSSFRADDDSSEYLAVTTDGSRGVWAARGSVKVWDLARALEPARQAAHAGPVSGVAISIDGRQAVSASHDRTLKVWDLGSGREVRVLREHGFGVNGVAVLPDDRVVSASFDTTLKLWDLKSGTALRTFVGHNRDVRAVSVTPNGRWAVSVGEDRTLRVWDLESGEQVRQHDYPFHWITTIRCCADGMYALGTPHDMDNVAFRCHRLDASEAARSFTVAVDRIRFVNGVAPLPGGKAITAGDDGMLLIWDLGRGGVVRRLEAGVGGLSALDVTSDGRRGVSTSWSGRVQVWDLEAGTVESDFQVDGLLTCCAISEGGKVVVVGERSGALHIFEVI